MKKTNDIQLYDDNFKIKNNASASLEEVEVLQALPRVRWKKLK